jgi:uncharacterized membrane protein HdeD (DUF308 family)
MNVASNATTTPIVSVARKTAGWSIALSILMIVCGILAMVIPPVAGLAVTIFVGWLLLFSGAMHLVFAWQTRETGGVLWELLVGVLYIVAGVYLLSNPVAGLVSLTLGLAIYLFVEGILEFILAVRLRPAPGSGWLFVDAAITLILAFMIWRTWPLNTAWVIGILVGISMLFSGIARLMISLAARRLVNALA